MNINVIEGKEIEFIELLYTLQNTINNDKHIERFLNCLSIEKEDFNQIIASIEKIDCEIVNIIFTRLKLRSTISINNAGRKYDEFSEGSLEAFIASEQGKQILALYSVWKTICELNTVNKYEKKTLLSTFYFYQIMGELEYRIKTHFTNTLNNEAQLAKIMQQLSIEQVLEFSNTQIYKELNNELIPLQENDEKDDLIDECLENQIPLYTSHNNYVFKILEGTFGYNVFFTNEIKPIKNCKVEELDLRLCINIPYESDTETSILKTSLHYEPTRQIFLTDIQHMYNKYKKLFSLNPYSTIKTKRLEAETCFIIPLYIIVKQRFKNTKVSQHLLFTITGLIAYDFGILKLDDKYLPNDNLSSYNDILRKKVMHIVNNNDNLINID